MATVEKVLMGGGESGEDFRRGFIAQIGAWRLEHPDAAVDYQHLFGGWTKKLKEDFYAQRHTAVRSIEEAFIKIIDGDVIGVDARDLAQAELMRTNLHARGYTDASARPLIAWLLRRR